MRAVEHARQVDPDHLVPDGGVDVRREAVAARPCDAGVVVENVQGAERTRGFVDDARGVGGTARVRDAGARGAAVASDRIRGFARAGFVDVADEDARAGACERERAGAAEARSASSDEGDFPGECGHVRSS